MKKLITKVAIIGITFTSLIPCTTAYAKTGKIVQVENGWDNHVELYKDGTVTSSGSLWGSNTDNWSDIIDISTNYRKDVIGLKSDGTVIATDSYTESRTEDWTDIVAIDQGFYNGSVTAGLKIDGTVVLDYAKKGYEDVANWTNIISISVGSNHILGLKSDGTVVAAGENEYGQYSGVETWSNVKQISAGHLYSSALTNEGTVLTSTITNNYFAEDNAKLEVARTWTNIKQIEAGGDVIAGLREDGTVVIAEDDDSAYNGYNVSKWKNIVSINASSYHLSGITRKGKVKHVGENYYGEY